MDSGTIFNRGQVLSLKRNNIFFAGEPILYRKNYIGEMYSI
jgi:hypothetical protein